MEKTWNVIESIETGYNVIMSQNVEAIEFIR